jgi:hypothetical protein
MKLLSAALLFATSLIPVHSAIWEFDLGGLAGAGLQGGNVVDNRADSFAWGIEVGHNEIPGILYDDVNNVLEFHVGWGAHEVVSTAYDTGEIRGQLLAVVPEPRHYALITGALLLGVALSKRIKSARTSS